MQHADFLVEIHTEELPPKTLKRLAETFETEIKNRLTKLELKFGASQFFATPRRLAVLVKKLAAQQADTTVERKGVPLDKAFDQNGKPTPACEGFARSCGVTPADLITIENAQGKFIGYQQHVQGKTTQELLPDVVRQSLAALPVAKRMRWGANTVEFVRPVQAAILLYGNDVIEADILGVKTDRLTRGHRFHSKDWVSIASPARYEKSLLNKYVVADFAERKNKIIEQLKQLESTQLQNKAKILMDDALLDEVTGLVEWPVALVGQFDQAFLAVPQEALISAMQDHQRYFPVTDLSGKLLPHFIMVSNIESKNPQSVIAGNERVLRARLSDAAFFFTTDKKIKLSDRIERLKNIIFQAKLGTLHEKSERVAKLAVNIATQLQVNTQQAERAAMLAKTDLLTDMVGEFPELQGVMGYYYALHDGEGDAIANALNEQYMPRFSGDELPASQLGCALALADRIDTLVGVFGIGQAPTGDKDPFALRRAALGVLRILIEKELNLDLRALLDLAGKNYAEKLTQQNTVQDVLTFILERLRPWYQDQGITVDVLSSVAALNLTRPFDIHRRVRAVQKFKNLPDAESLSVANKRVSNILAKSDSAIELKNIDTHLFEHNAERVLAEKLAEKRAIVTTFVKEGNYTEILTELATLRAPVDDFFDNVMVNAENPQQRANRLLMLKQLRELFLQVADIALLQ